MKKGEVIRKTPDVKVGLSSGEVQIRKNNKLVNRTKKVVGKSYLQIFISNIFTFFNFVGLVIFVLLLLCGSYTNMLFVAIIVANTLIGIAQEIRSKLAVERLSIVSEPRVDVVRDGKKQNISTRDVVIDDILLFSTGKQICCDSILLCGELKVNESMLTGERDSVKKKPGDTLYSGSFAVSGNGTACCQKVGKDNYIEQLSAKVKKVKEPNSQLMKGIRRIIKSISVIVFPLGVLTFFLSRSMRMLFNNGLHLSEIWDGYVNGATIISEYVNRAIKAMSGAMIGMVPSGMVLLMSVALAVAALKLAKKKVLIRELPCIEMLARVDTLCLDKTGTITDGSMAVEKIIPLRGDESEINKVIASLLDATGDDSMTAQAVKKHLEGVERYESINALPFSSERKYSAATLSGKGTYALGAAEFMFKNPDPKLLEQCLDLHKEGMRVLTVGVSHKQIVNDAVEGLEPIAIVVLRDSIRPDAPEIIKWFKDNDVAVKIISGDHPQTVSIIAHKVGVDNADRYISLEGMTDEQVEEIANDYTVFGRVTPEQKAILVRAMKKAGHTVAMTGDGVNDILAMRESDCAISVGCGTDAAKTVADLVLMDDKFGSMPSVVAEGRQVVNNIQNSSSLFLMKTIMTILTTIMCLIIRKTYPFEPQNLYAVEFFLIGVCSFLLALRPNNNIIRGNFVLNTLKSALPSGVAMFVSVVMTYIFASLLGINTDLDKLSTVAMFSMTVTACIALWFLLYPYNLYNVMVGVIGMLGVVGCFLVFPSILDLIAVWFGESHASPMMVPIGNYSILFIAINSFVMGSVIIGVGFLVNYLDKRKLLSKAMKRLGVVDEIVEDSTESQTDIVSKIKNNRRKSNK